MELYMEILMVVDVGGKIESDDDGNIEFEVGGKC